VPTLLKCFRRKRQESFLLSRRLSLFDERINVLEFFRSEAERTEESHKVLFLFSDALSLDDPGPAGRRLCQNDITPVVIGIGRVNLRVVERIRSHCGVYFGIDTPVENVILRIKVNIIKN